MHEYYIWYSWIFEIEVLIGFCFAVAVFVAFYAKLLIKEKKVRTIINIILGGLITTPVLKYRLYMDAQILTTLGGLATMTFGYILKEVSNAKARKIKEIADTKAQEKKEEKQKLELTTRDKTIAVRLLSLEEGVADVKMMLKDMQDDTDLKNVLRNSIRVASNDFVNINRALDDPYKNILMDYAKITENLSLRWYNSEFRGRENRDKMKKYLNNYIQPSLKDTDILMNNSIRVVKKVTDHDTKGHLFSDFVKKNMIYNEFELLIMTLSQNGFSNEKEVVNEFTDFIDRLFTKFADLVKIWNLLDNRINEL